MFDFMTEFAKAQEMLLPNNKTNMIDLGLFFIPYLEQKHSLLTEGKSSCSSNMTFTDVSYWSQNLCFDKHSKTPCCQLEELLSTDHEQVFSFRQFLLDSLAPNSNYRARREAVGKMAAELLVSAQEPFVQNFHPLVAACKFGDSSLRFSRDCSHFFAHIFH